HHRLLLNFNLGYGFTGIAVALMGRNHPIGVVLASLLFGILSQGGAELAFEIPAITPEMIVVIQGLIILFSGRSPISAGRCSSGHSRCRRGRDGRRLSRRPSNPKRDHPRLDAADPGRDGGAILRTFGHCRYWT